jgi:hypothetical protein
MTDERPSEVRSTLAPITIGPYGNRFSKNTQLYYSNSSYNLRQHGCMKQKIILTSRGFELMIKRIRVHYDTAEVTRIVLHCY